MYIINTINNHTHIILIHIYILLYSTTAKGDDDAELLAVARLQQPAHPLHHEVELLNVAVDVLVELLEHLRLILGSMGIIIIIKQCLSGEEGRARRRRGEEVQI